MTLIKLLGRDSRDQGKRVKAIVEQLATHSFGNYVLQKAIMIEIEWSLKKQLLEEIKLKSQDLMDTKHGPKVLQKLKATYPRIFGGAPTADGQRSEKPKAQGQGKFAQGQ